MRRLETSDMLLYYPEGQDIDAWRFAARVEGCLGYLRRVAHVHNSVADDKVVAILPELQFNNAFVTPRISGYETLAVVPTFNTVETFSLEMGLPPDPAAIGCHEITHYVQFQQIAGFAWFWNRVFGDVYTPQIGLDPWFDEGLAVYYESKLQPGLGRLAWPFWRGSFAAGFAGKRINGGDLSALKREFHGGNQYLVGSQFVRFLADRYGEDKLWKLIHVQARSIVFPLFVNVRFWSAFGKSLSGLIDEFADEAEAGLPPRARPREQRVLRSAGNNARYARAPDGTEALIMATLDRPASLTIFGPDGDVRAERDLAQVLPPRRLVIAAPTLASGLSFSRDGRTLYFVALDLDPTYQASRLCRYDVASGELSIVARDLRGPGGSLSPDGRRYVFAHADGDHHDLAEVDVATGAMRVIAHETHGAYIANPRFSPDGTRVVATRFDGLRFRIVVIDPADGRLLSTLATGDDLVSDPSWVDDGQVIYLGGAPGDAGFQVYGYELASGRIAKLTQAPYLAFQPDATGGQTLRFLNREGWGWTLDEIPLPPVAPPPPPPSPAPDAPGAPPALAAAAPAQNAPPPPPPIEAIPTVIADQPASSVDHLFVPHLYGPTFAAFGRAATLLGAVLAGGDRLSKHRWALAGYYQFIDGGHASGTFGYSNRQLAPLTLTLSASQLTFMDVPPRPADAGVPKASDFTLYRRDRELAVDATRAFWDNPVSVGFSFVESYRPADEAVLVPLRRLAGPHLSAAFVGTASAPYPGPVRQFAAVGDVAAYPRTWNSAGFGFVDARGELAAVMPLPLYRRHTLALDARARDLAGVPAGERVLLVGGYFGQPLLRRAGFPETTLGYYPGLPAGARFVEPLRGFEDHVFAADRIAIAEATYRLPFIIDYGWASTLWLLPSLFVRQIDLDLFGVAASEGRSRASHTAAGGAVTLRCAVWVVPLSLQYQLARRFTDDQALVHLVVLGL
jgi:Tol biopolymer transport system component